MTVLASTLKNDGLLLPLLSSCGVSPEASTIKTAIKDVTSHLREPLSIRHVLDTALSALAEAHLNAVSPGWHTETAGSAPQTHMRAVEFLMALPTTAPPPDDVSFDPDGEVDITWRRGPRKIISISIGPSGRISYAALVGLSKAHGTEYFADEVPQAVLHNLARVVSRQG